MGTQNEMCVCTSYTRFLSHLRDYLHTHLSPACLQNVILASVGSGFGEDSDLKLCRPEAIEKSTSMDNNNMADSESQKRGLRKLFRNYSLGSRDVQNFSFIASTT